MIGELLRISLKTEERIMYEESSDECQHGDSAIKKQVHKRHKKAQKNKAS